MRLNCWEMPFDEAAPEELVTQTVHRLEEREVEWQLRAVSQEEDLPVRKAFFAWFSPVDARGQGGFVVCQKQFNFPVSLYARSVGDFKMASLQLPFDTAWENDQIARLFWLNESGELRKKGETACSSLLVSPRGLATWRRYGRANFPCAWSWTKPLTVAEFVRVPALDVWAQLEELLKDTTSESAYARRFAHLENDERRTLISNWAHGNETRFKSLLRDLLWKHDVWNEPPPRDKMTLTFRAPLEVEVTFEDEFAVYGVDAPPSLLSDLEQLVNYFEPLDLEVVNKSCVRNWMRFYFRIEVSAHRPTMHEQLEVSLHLREWLEQSGA